MRSDAPYFIVLLWLMPDDFTHQGESAAIEWIERYPSENVQCFNSITQLSKEKNEENIWFYISNVISYTAQVNFDIVWK